MPNDRVAFENRKKSGYVQEVFDCKRLTVQGGKRPNQPRSVFSGVFKSCMKQLQVAKGTDFPQQIPC